MFWNKKSNYGAEMAAILASVKNKEDLLGISPIEYPSKEQVVHTASNIVRHAQTDGYQVFAAEVWARVLGNLDKILDVHTPTDKLPYYIGAVKAELDLLRMSYHAREVIKQDNKLKEPLPR